MVLRAEFIADADRINGQAGDARSARRSQRRSPGGSSTRRWAPRRGRPQPRRRRRNPQARGLGQHNHSATGIVVEGAGTSEPDLTLSTIRTRRTRTCPTPVGDGVSSSAAQPTTCLNAAANSVTASGGTAILARQRGPGSFSIYGGTRSPGTYLATLNPLHWRRGGSTGTLAAATSPPPPPPRERAVADHTRCSREVLRERVRELRHDRPVRRLHQHEPQRRRPPRRRRRSRDGADAASVRTRSFAACQPSRRERGERRARSAR